MLKTETVAADSAVTNGAAGVGESFASFLSEESAGGIEGSPSAAVGVGALDKTVQDEAGQAERAQERASPANLAAPTGPSIGAFATTQNLAVKGVAGSESGSPVRVSVAGRAKTTEAESKAGEKRSSGEVAAGQTAPVESSMPVAVVVPVTVVSGNVAGAEALTPPAEDAPAENRSIYIQQGQTVEGEGSGKAEPAVRAAEGGSALAPQDDGAQGDAAGVVSVPVNVVQPELTVSGGTVKPTVELQTAAIVLPQKKSNAMPSVADKSSMPADPIFGSSLVADPLKGTANQHPFYGASWNLGDRIADNTGREAESTAADPARVSGGGEKVAAAVRPEASASRATSTTSQRIDDPGLADPGAFGLTLSGAVGGSNDGGVVREGVRSEATPSSSEQFAMERLQTAEATRVLGDAMKSAMGLGIQTESFGRVTIHTATEGNHLLAQVTLEDGRQSATLVSHVPGVEQKLTQQFGMEAAVTVSTVSQSSPGGSLYGDGSRDDPRQRQDSGETSSAKPGQDRVAGMEPGELSRPSPWIQSVNAGRLDVTV